MISKGVQRQFVRLASTKSDKIPVQLLKAQKSLGVAGEIVRVKPAFMRNFLHVDNKACYITDKQGPRIPVVTKQRKIQVKTKKPKKTIVAAVKEQKDTEPVLSLDDLSSLFSGMRAGTQTKAPTYEAEASASTYNLIDLEDALPQTYTLSSQKFPVSKETLSQAVFNATGIEVPTSMIRVKKESEDLNEVLEAGDYIWTFQAVGDVSLLKKNLRVQ